MITGEISFQIYAQDNKIFRLFLKTNRIVANGNNSLPSQSLIFHFFTFMHTRNQGRIWDFLEGWGAKFLEILTTFFLSEFFSEAVKIHYLRPNFLRLFWALCGKF